MAQLSSLCDVELQIIMHLLDERSLLIFARCSRTTLAAAMHPFAWRTLEPLQRECGGEGRGMDAPQPASDRPRGVVARAFSGMAAALGITSGQHSSAGARDAIYTPAELALSLHSTLLKGRQIDVHWMPCARGVDLDAQIVSLASIPSLHGLSLHGGALHDDSHGTSDGVLARICDALLANGHQRKLVKLRIVGFHIGNLGGTSLMELLSHSELLDDLSLSFRVILASASYVCAIIADLASVTRRLSHFALTVADPYGLLDARGNDLLLAPLIDHSDSQLQTLEIGADGLPDRIITPLLAALPRCARLERLNLRIFNAAWEHLPLQEMMSQLTSLRELHLGVLTDEAAFLRLAECIPLSRSLTTLAIEGSTINGSMGQALATAMGLSTSLTALDVSRYMLSDDCVVQLARAAATSVLLRSLHLGYFSTELSSEAAAALVAAVRDNRPLTELSLRGVRANVQEIAAALSHSSLTSLTLHFFHSAALAVLLDAAGSMRHLRTLRIRATLSDVDVAPLAAAMRQSRSLRTLDLHHSVIDDDGIAVIMAALPQSTVMELNLSHVGRATVRCHPAMIAAVQRSPRLRCLLIFPDFTVSAAYSLRRQLRRIRPDLDVGTSIEDGQLW